jgi:hypothetical protein
MYSRRTALALGLAITATAAFACGPSTPTGETPEPTGTAPTPAPTGEPAAGGSAPAPTPEPGGTTAPAPAAKGHDPVSVTPSKMDAKLKKLGIDVKKFPDLSKIPLAKKKKLMPLFQKSLGMDSCEGCHAEGDFKKETKNIKMARNMWKHYVQGLKLDGGGTLFCDSCHAGQEHVLPARSDKDAMEKFMAAEYEGKLSRTDGEDHSCTTCHTTMMEYKIFEDVWGIK